MQLILTVLGTGVGVIIVIFTAWLNAKIAIAKLEVKVLQLEKEFEREKTDNTALFNRIDNNFKELFKGINEIKISLENKAERK